LRRGEEVRYALGVDVGGTKVATAILDQDGKIIKRLELPSNPIDKEKMFEQVVRCIDGVIEQSTIPFADICGMGIGVPGKINRDEGIAVFQNNLPWRDFPVVQRLKQRFPIDNIVLDNDVYMATYAEWKLSNLGNECSFVYLTISTGISCAIINNGSFIRGEGFAGEVGSLPVLNPFSSGMITLEQSSSGVAMEKAARHYLRNPQMSTEEFFKQFELGNELAKELMKKVIAPLAYGVYSIITLLDPQRIVLGGGVVNHNPFMLELIEEGMKEYFSSGHQYSANKLQLSQLKGDAGITGAGLRAMESMVSSKNLN